MNFSISCSFRGAALSQHFFTDFCSVTVYMTSLQQNNQVILSVLEGVEVAKGNKSLKGMLLLLLIFLNPSISPVHY